MSLVGLLETAETAVLPENASGIMCVLDQTGDSRFTWDRRNSTEVKAARKQFEELQGKGYLAYQVKKGGEKGKVITSFDPDAEAIIMSPPLEGG